MIPIPAFAQKEGTSDFSRSSLFLELGGNGIMYSINYDHRFSEQLTGRIGIAALPQFFVTGVVLTAPLMVNYLTAKGKHHFEIGIGTTILLDISPNFTDIDLPLTATIGYRYQPPDGGFNFRIGITPFYIFTSFGFSPFVNTTDRDEPLDTHLRLFGGISFGYTFRQK